MKIIKELKGRAKRYEVLAELTDNYSEKIALLAKATLCNELLCEIYPLISKIIKKDIKRLRSNS